MKTDLKDDIFVTDDMGKETLIKFTAGVFRERWECSYDYLLVDPIWCESKSLNHSILVNADFMSAAFYMSFLADRAINYRMNDISDWARKEITTWDKSGGLCIYMSIVHYCLLWESGVKEERLKYVQGFYTHPSHGIMSLFTNTIQQSGVHAFITVDDSVVDFSINQEACVFNFMDGDFIIGQIPETMELGGWAEDLSIVKKYARKIARSSGMTYYQWIRKHKLYAYETTLKSIQDRAKNSLD